MLLDTLQGYLVPPPPPVAFFMQHLEICLPTALLTTEAYFSFQFSLTHSLLLFFKNVNNIYVSVSQYRIEWIYIVL